MSQESILHAIRAERERQDAKFGEQNHPMVYWLGILMEEVGEVAKDIIENRPTHEVEIEIVQVAAVAVALIECIQRNKPLYALDSMVTSAKEPQP